MVVVDEVAQERADEVVEDCAATHAQESKKVGRSSG